MYDIIVIGGGHAGVEAALSSARLGNKTLMIVGSIRRIANMPCNPSVGGPAKGISFRFKWCRLLLCECSGQESLQRRIPPKFLEVGER